MIAALFYFALDRCDGVLRAALLWCSFVLPLLARFRSNLQHLAVRRCGKLLDELCLLALALEAACASGPVQCLLLLVSYSR